MNTTQLSIRAEIREELETTRARFHNILDSLSEQDLKKQSLNAG